MKERQVAVITVDGRVEMRTQPLPELKEGMALIKTHATLISPGTEMNGVKQRRTQPPPDAKEYVFGYSAAGEILEVRGDFPRLRPGMRVAAMGGHAQHANYSCVPVNMLCPIADDLPYEQACFACLGATALQSVRRARPELGEFGAVLGLGIVGNLAAQLAQLSGARVMAWEALDFRIDTARRCGIRQCVNFTRADAQKLTEEFAAPYGLDFGIMAFGGDATKAFESLYKCMKLSADGHRMGRVILVGGCTFAVRGGAGMGNLDVLSSARTGPGYHDEAYEYGRDYPAAFVQFTTQRNLREITALMTEKRLLVEPMITHRLPLEQVGQAADMLLDHPDRTLGVVLAMRH